MNTKCTLLSLSLALTVFACAVPARAQGATAPAAGGEKQQLILQVLDAARATRNAELGFNLVMDQQMRGMNMALRDRIDKQTGKTDEQKMEEKNAAVARMDKILHRFRALVDEKIDFKKQVTDIYLKLYDKYYTEDDLKALLAFYKSATGQKSLDVMPQLSQEAIQMINATALSSIKAASEQVDAEIKAGQL